MILTKEMLDQRLKHNGWTWALISTVTPGVVRVQLCADMPGEMDLPQRKCIEAPTIEEALNAAEQFVMSTQMT